ncbi:Bud site selection protein 6 [Saxophila tyrrhenica]|uniref:Bud site selection protein 6 n=1 Tax=Saxophila tyrrhenica TaxID=1690608 RepID=A0AAV9PGF2_9PEZI|nr:Bud site selection protein 6 [Saxophila tyrrhenica]
MDAASDPTRSSAGSGRSSGSRSKQNPQQQLSTIEKSVTHLLVATKQLLETLTQWSRGSASEGEVSDVYVRLGYEFNIACRAFGAIGVDTSDLGPVPDLLRAILEDTLSQEASQASLDKYLPRIRDIIINLLHGLKKKQQRLRQKGTTSSTASGSGQNGLPPRQASVASNLSAESQVNQHLEEFPARTQSSRSFAQRQGSGEVAMPDLPPRTTSAPGRQSPKRAANLSPANSIHQSASRDTIASDSGSSISSNAMQNIPVIAPYPETDTIPTNTQFEQPPQPPPLPGSGSPSVDPPRPPPKQNDALSALQRGGELERRASRRFSAYQIQKHLGTSMNGIAAIPPAQNSPIPNRGRDARESLNAVRSRGSVMHSRARSRKEAAAGYEPSPSRINEVRRISEESEQQQQKSAPELHPPSRPSVETELDSPNVKTPEDKLGSYPFPDTPGSPQKFSATLNGPMEEPYIPDGPSQQLERRKTPTPKRSASRRAVVVEEQPRTPPVSQYVPEGSPQLGKELTLFLQYKSKIKKFVLPDGGDLSLARLQLAFIEKFAWNTQNNGTDLPEIYIQDPVSGVRHELEDLTDIKERSVLVLNIEALDEVKRHIDDGIGGLRRIVEGIKTSVEDQQSAIQRVSDRQQDAAREMAGFVAAGPPTTAPAPRPSSTTATPPPGIRPSASVGKDKSSQLTEIQSLRRDLAVVRQTYTTFVSSMQTTMTTLRTQAANVKTAASIPAMPSDPSSGRAYVDKGKSSLSQDSESIVNRVDDLQDLVEDLRKDVVVRGVRPLPRQLEGVSKDISTATADLKKLKEFLRREKPVWTKIWERELQVVCDDRDLLTLQEELAVDLEDDLEKAAATFALVEEATRQQNLTAQKDTGAPIGPGQLRSSSRGTAFAIDTGADPRKAKDSVLGEVRALQPNHESRLEAIERAERARLRELENRAGGEFQKELGSFVEEGRLKKTGGVEEVERIRLVREEKARREVQERQRERMRQRAEKEAGEANGAPPDAGAGTAEGGLEVPAKEGEERASSPESAVGFVDAREEAGTPANETANEKEGGGLG